MLCNIWYIHLFSYIYRYINNIHISQLQFLNIKLLQFRCSFIFCRSLHGQNDHSGQITDYPRISKSHLFFAWQKFMTFAVLLDPEAIRTMSPWESNGPPKRVSECTWMCRFPSPRIQIHKSVMDAMNEINRALVRHFSWAIKNSMEPASMEHHGQGKKDLYLHRFVDAPSDIFFDAIRHPKTACYNMWVTTKIGQIPL